VIGKRTTKEAACAAAHQALENINYMAHVLIYRANLFILEDNLYTETSSDGTEMHKTAASRKKGRPSQQMSQQNAGTSATAH